MRLRNFNKIRTCALTMTNLMGTCRHFHWNSSRQIGRNSGDTMPIEMLENKFRSTRHQSVKKALDGS